MADYRYSMYDITRSLQSLSINRDTEAAVYFDQIVGNYFDSISLSGATADNIQSSFTAISSIYRSSLRGTSSRPNWGDAGYRRAYICRFFMMHAYLVYWFSQRSLTAFLHFWNNKYFLHVCCLGGGPGSDVVGLVKFLRDSASRVTLDCTICDIYPEWETDWKALKGTSPAHELAFNVRYLRGNLTAKNHRLTTIGLITMQSADIITMVKFYSTVAAFMRTDDAHGDVLRQIFREMKPGALVLYIDNQYYSQHQEFRRIARAGGVTENLFEWHGTVTMPSVSHSLSIRRVNQASGITPMDSCKVSVMLLRKPNGIFDTGSPSRYRSIQHF